MDGDEKIVRERRALKLEKKFFKNEILSYKTYESLAAKEKHPGVKKLLEKLATTEKRHVDIWRKILEDKDIDYIELPKLLGLKVAIFGVIRRLLGVAFAIRFLEKNESDWLEEYSNARRSKVMSKIEKIHITSIIRDESVHEKMLSQMVTKFEGELAYIGSIIFGLNDGLVEVLAAVVGFAVLARSSGVVVIIGLIVGAAGTLSMAGGAYLSSKSSGLIGGTIDADAESKNKRTPRKDASYTGVYYLLGSLVPVLPFILGMAGYQGILASIILVSVALTLVSIVIAVISGTSMKTRIAEMLIISLGAAAFTIVLGIVLRTYFGITV